MKIMIIDDDKDLCYLTKLILTKHGYDVAVALDAAAGLQYARHYKPNLILMDVMMAGVGDGYRQEKGGALRWFLHD